MADIEMTLRIGNEPRRSAAIIDWHVQGYTNSLIARCLHHRGASDPAVDGQTGEESLAHRHLSCAS